MTETPIVRQSFIVLNHDASCHRFVCRQVVRSRLMRWCDAVAAHVALLGGLASMNGQQHERQQAPY